ncbi:hypothetical protein BX600DRAFT_240251 [Xylariales sp. PMI_506]|nr:hypothetical protein BX600DRAFT_240251 [Xylariales sp. PMI_506]
MSTSAAQRVPAWKRLGLKLKGSSGEQPDDTSGHTGAASTAKPSTLTPQESSPAAAKRKSFGATTTDEHLAKKLRKDPPNPTQNQSQQPKTPRTPKSVSFAAEPEFSPAPAAKDKATVGKKQKSKQPATKSKEVNDGKSVNALPVKNQSSVNLQPAVEYLRQWHSARDQWKFNKNHQTRLLENVFSDGTTIPAVDINIFYEYIRGLQGFVRKRFRETAAEVAKKDMEQGKAGFATSAKDAAERKQKEYEEVIAGFLREGPSPGKRRFEEVDYVLRTADMEMQRRVVKRMRAERVLEEMEDAEDSETTASTMTASSGAEGSQGQPKGAATDGSQAGNNDGDKHAKIDEGPQKKSRKRKVRTTEVEDDDSSSSSESESDEETSSSGSSSEESDSDEEMELNPGQAPAAETSSSSSSSSDSSDSDSDGTSSEDESGED